MNLIMPALSIIILVGAIGLHIKNYVDYKNEIERLDEDWERFLARRYNNE